jgi:hypothetical protein
MSDSDLNEAQNRTASKTDYLTPPVGTMANVGGIASNVSGITPAERAARDDAADAG